MLTAMIGDAHCHLADLADPDAAVAEALREEVSPILAVSMGPDDARRVLDLKRRHPEAVRAGVGLHPSRIPGIDDARLEQELAFAAQRAPGADFIGEIGLDFKDASEEIQQQRQRAALERLLDIAERSRLPVNLHTRRADGELVEIAAAFRRRTGLPVLLHWFTHSKRLARRCAEAGLYISAGPSIEMDPGQREVARHIDRDFLLVETDSPVEYAGRGARPAWARRVAAALAAARAEMIDALEEALAANLSRYLVQSLPGTSEASR
jgi:TatD DNase family protein